MIRFLDKSTGSKLRNATRLVLLAAVGFGLDWTGEQVALFMGAFEGLLALAVRDKE